MARKSPGKNTEERTVRTVAQGIPGQIAHGKTRRGSRKPAESSPKYAIFNYRRSPIWVWQANFLHLHMRSLPEWVTLTHAIVNHHISSPRIVAFLLELSRSHVCGIIP